MIASRWVPVLLGVACATPGCEARDRRLLVLDLDRADSSAIEVTAGPWRDAGYHVEYRPSHPHVTHSDLDRYFTILVLGAGTTKPGTDHLGAGDLVLLGEWVERGGVVVLGYPAEEAGLVDRWMMNRWLAWRGAGIVIGDSVSPPGQPDGGAPSRIPGAAVRSSTLRGTHSFPLPAGKRRAIEVSNPGRALVRVVSHPPSEQSDAVLAASRLGRGLVLVVSRHTLGAPGPERRVDPTSPAVTPLLTALAAWSRRPAEWAGIPPADGREPLVLLNGPAIVDRRPPLLAPPEAATVELHGP